MYYYLTSAIKRRAILELKDSFSRHPIYSKAVPFIQNKFAFTERPQMGIVVKGSSANKVSLSGDNFVGNVQSYVMLAYVGEPAYPIEWVREDLDVIRANDGQIPLSAGIYYIEILTAPDNPQSCGTFAVDPLLTVTGEPLLRFISGIEHEAQLEHVPTKGTVRIWVNGRVMLKDGKDYQVNYQNGAVTFLTRFLPNDTVVADYRFPAPSMGPFEFQWNTSDFRTLPGVVMAFGKRAKVGDKVALRITTDREETALAYGGKFEVSLDLDVLSQDTTATEEMADLAVMFLWGEKKPALEFEGIEIVDISIGGEAEETYDEAGDIYYYTASLSIQFRADWEIHVPMPLTLSRVTQEKKDGSDGLVYAGPSNIFFSTFPTIVGRNNDFERITLDPNQIGAVMPQYVFECQNDQCNCRFERVLKMGEHPTHPCPSCQEEAPRCLEGEGFAFGFKTAEGQEGNSGVHKDDYPTADQAVGRSAERRWLSYGERKKVKEEARAGGQTHALTRRDDKAGAYVEYEAMSQGGLSARKATASKAFEAIRVAKERRAGTR